MSASLLERLRGSRLGAWALDPNPILVKELRATFRTALFVRFLYLSTAITALLVLSGGVLLASGSLPPAEVGQFVFNLFFSLALFLLCLIAPGYASAAITSERESETWESLALSGMSPWRIVMGKFWAAYASIALVLVALSPVVGIAFLFGGVSPLQVLAGFVSLLVVLASAIAFGLSVSAQLKSTRASIGIATLVYVPIAAMATMALAIFGEVAHREWGLATSGPFFYTEAFATRLDEWDTWALLVGGPLFAIGMPVWFMLATAVSGVRPETEDKSGPLKGWAVAMAVLSCAFAVLVLTLMDDGTERGKMGVIEAFGIGTLCVFFALVFMNDPPIPSRAWERAMARAPLWRRAFTIVGPGAAGTLRFGVLLTGGTTALFLAWVIGFRRLADPRYDLPAPYDVGTFAVAAGGCVVAWFALALGGWLRCVLKSGLAARVLTSAVLVASIVLPFLVALILDSDSLEDLDRDAPLLVYLSSLYPTILGVSIARADVDLWHVATLVVPVGAYGSFALVFWALVEVRARRARAVQRARIAAFDRADASASAAEPEPQPETGSGTETWAGPGAEAWLPASTSASQSESASESESESGSEPESGSSSETASAADTANRSKSPLGDLASLREIPIEPAPRKDEDEE